MFRFVLLLLGLLTLAAASYAQGQTAQRPPLTCVHSSGAWDPKTSTLTVIFLSKGCDVATASRAYTWSEDDENDYGGMVTAQANSMAFTTGCLQEEMANHSRDCGQSTHDLIAESIHAARAEREALCGRHADWWVVTINGTGAYGALESCSDQ